MEAVDFVMACNDGNISQNVFSNGFAQKTSKNDWKTQGLRMFAHKYYEQAEKCFIFANEKPLAMRAKGYTLANKAVDVLAEIENNEQSNLDKKLTKTDKKEIKMRKANALSLFKEAAEVFSAVSEEFSAEDCLKIKKEAAKCFSSANQHKKAAKIFFEIGLHGQAAEAELVSGNYEAAGDLFCLKEEYQRAIESYKLGFHWEKAVKTIFQFGNRMGFEEKQRYIHKFVPAALEELSPKLVPLEEKETQFALQIAKENPQVIIENSDEDSESEESIQENIEKIEENIEKTEENFEKTEENIENIEKTDENIEKTDENIEKTEKNFEKTEENIEKTKENIEKIEENPMKNILENEKEPEKSESFILLSKETSFALLSENLEEEIDPCDEWLQLETGSVLESLGSLIHPDGSIASDYSVLDSNFSSVSGKIIKTRGDIYIEDITMRKIIEYISMFSEEMTSYLKSLRSYESLVSSSIIPKD